MMCLKHIFFVFYSFLFLFQKFGLFFHKFLKYFFWLLTVMYWVFLATSHATLTAVELIAMGSCTSTPAVRICLRMKALLLYIECTLISSSDCGISAKINRGSTFIVLLISTFPSRAWSVCFFSSTTEKKFYNSALEYFSQGCSFWVLW